MSKYQLLTEEAAMPAVSLRGAVKLPTWDQSDFFGSGSGSPDIGLGLAVEKLVAGRWMFHANATGVIPVLAYGPPCQGLPPSNTYGRKTCRARPILISIRRRFPGPTQLYWTMGITEAVPGFSYRVAPHFLWQLYAVENLDFYIGSSPDLTVSTVFTYRFESGSSRQ